MKFQSTHNIPGGGCMVATVRSRSPKFFRLPIYNFVSFDYKLTFTHTAAILDSKMVSIVVFSNYGYVKQIHVNKIRQIYIITRQLLKGDTSTPP